MLTEAEIEWLERRKNLCLRCYRSTFCRAGKRHSLNADTCRFWEINVSFGALKENFRDAAEFEARVAEKLSALVNDAPPPDLWPQCISCNAFKNDELDACMACVMKEARIAVEAEIDDENR